MNELSETQIKSILKRYGYSIIGVYSKNELPKILNPGWYVINLESSDRGNGTHWTCYRYGENECEYFDSFGIICPNEIIEATGNIFV